MQTIPLEEWLSLPEQARREVFDFFLFIKQRYASMGSVSKIESSEIHAYSEHSANTIVEWNNEFEDSVWK